MSEKIIPLPKDIHDFIYESDPMFLVKGCRQQQNHPSQPPQLTKTSFHVGSLDELHVAIMQENLYRFKVYEISGAFGNPSQLRQDAEKTMQEKQEAQEREMYEKLKAKFEKELQSALK